MPVAMLNWSQAALLTGVLVLVAVGCALCPVPRVRALGPFAREGAIIAGLYAVWQLAGKLSVVGTAGAYARAEWIVHAEHDLHLPSEVDVQHLLTSHDVIANFADYYYATMHFTVMGVFLVWLFVRHREQYRPVRRVLALSTLLCLIVQLMPVAPPRLLPQYGFTDTALDHHASVYGAGGFDALSAMPSVHVLWATLVGVTVWRLGSRWGRALGPAHFVVTVLVVVSTANHFWADGIVAIAILALSAYLCRVGTRLLTPVGARLREHLSVPVPAKPTTTVPVHQSSTPLA